MSLTGNKMISEVIPNDPTYWEKFFTTPALLKYQTKVSFKVSFKSDIRSFEYKMYNIMKTHKCFLKKVELESFNL